MRQHRTRLVGRHGEIGEVARVLGSTGGGARIMLVTGRAGSGKTAVVEQAERLAVQEGTKVLRLDWQRAQGEAGTPALADAVCYVLAKIHDGRLPVRITAIRRVQLRTSGRGGEVAVLSTLGEMLADAAHYVPFALIIDDIHRIPAETASALGLLLRVFRPAAVPVVMAGRSTGPGRADGRQLPAACDTVLELPPLPREEVGALIAQRLGRPVEPALVTAVLRSLGPLAGDPAAVLSVLASLEEHGSLLERDGQVCLSEREGRLRLSTDDMERWLGAGAPDSGAVGTAAALARVVGDAELRLDDLHRLGPLDGRDTEAVGRAVDQLVRDQVLTVGRAGRIIFAVPALAATLRTLPGPANVRSLHTRIVTSVTDRLGGAAAGAGYPRLAEHVAAAGAMLDDALAVPLLLSAARRGQADDWPGAVRGYRAALRRLPPDDSRTPGVLRESAGLSLRYADHAGVLALSEPLLACLGEQHREDLGDLERVTRAWALSALYEHRSPYADDADPRYRAALEQVPGAAALSALGGLYGIGPVTPPEASRRTAAGCVPAAGEEWSGAGPVPSPAEVRLLAAAVGSGADFERARRDLPAQTPLDDAALDRLRTAAAYGDLAGALKAVLGDRYAGAGNSTAVRYHAMVRDYLAGHWDSALAAARRIEMRGRSDRGVGVGQPARALAAEIQLMRGELGHAREWLELIPDTVTHPLVVRARLGIRHWSGQVDEASDELRRDIRRARESGLLAGLDRALLLLVSHKVQENDPQAAWQALDELEALHEEVASPMTWEAVLVGRGAVHGDADSALAAYRLVQQRGDRPLAVHCCQVLTDIGDDPRLWLAEAMRGVHALGIGRPVRSLLGPAARRRNVSLPRHRATREGLNEQEVRLIEMVSDGSTNRQIAARLACSEKTVEQRLTRVFQRTGCRSRTELAAAWLAGGLVRPGLVPEGRPHGGGDLPAARSGGV